MHLGLLLLSAATLALEVALTRVFSLTQWYHFAFMAVAVALLGFGASGSLLAILGPGDGLRRARRACLGFAVATLALHPAIRLIPFDAYRLAIDPFQIAYLLLFVAVLVAPFVCSGLASAALLSAKPARSASLYAANLIGSGIGSLAALLLLPAARDAGMPLVLASLAALAWALFAEPSRRQMTGVIVACLILTALASQPPAIFRIPLSEYKALSVVASFQGSRHVLSRWNAFSRVDVVEGPAVRSAPGLSLAFRGDLPAQPAATVDGDSLRVIPMTTPNAAASAYVEYMPASIAFRLRQQARTLILQAGPGLDVLTARRLGASFVVAVEANPLLPQVAREIGSSVFDDVDVVIDSGRSFLATGKGMYDVIVIGLAESFRAVSAGDFSLSESYMYTVEGIEACYRRLAPDGILVITRWAQWPPSEDVRAGALVAAALRRAGAPEPALQVAVFRGVQTVTILARKGPFTENETAALRRLWRALNYDAVYLPGPEEPGFEGRDNEGRGGEGGGSEFVFLPDERQRDLFAALLAGRAVPDQPFDISASSDDRPFFFHLFKWQQTEAILRNIGKTWQPFGGAGYLVLVVLLAVAVFASAALILLPLLLRPLTSWAGGAPTPLRAAPRDRPARSARPSLRWLGYFSLLGLGFLLVEIPLLQKTILYLGQPVYAASVVLCSMLVASGLGSLASARLPLRGALFAAIVLAVLVQTPFLGLLYDATLSWPFAARLPAAALGLAPVGFLLGMPFPCGLRAAERSSPGITAWAWAANGCASVIASVLAALLTVSFGFTAVLVLAAAVYALAGVSVGRGSQRRVKGTE